MQPDSTAQSTTSRSREVSPGTATRCVTCEAFVDGPYCSTCGQHQRAGRHTLRSLLRGTLGRLFNAEEGLGHTAIQLTLRPGAMIRRYIGGQTVKYTHPAGYLIVAVGAFALSNRIFGRPTGAAEVDKVFALLLIPFVAAVSRVIHWRGRYNFAEHLIAVVYLCAHAVIGLSILHVAVPLMSPSLARQYASTALLMSVVYYVWGYGRVLQGRALLSALTGLTGLVLGAVTWLVALTVLVGWLRH